MDVACRLVKLFAIIQVMALIAAVPAAWGTAVTSPVWDMQVAFVALRGYARSHNLRLSDVARAVAEGTADLDTIASRRTTPGPR